MAARPRAMKTDDDTIDGKSGDVAAQRRALLDRIAMMERRGAILPSDAHTLRNQVNDCTSGQWRAAEERLKQLTMSWNPYQDYSAEGRREKEREESKKSASPSVKPRTMNHPPKNQKPSKKDFYELLQLSGRDATHEEIKKQFRRLALLIHPDKQIQATREEETSPTRARIRRKLVEKVRLADASFYIYLKIPRAVANLPKVALEVQEHMPINVGSDADDANRGSDAILPIRVRPRNTVNYIKYFVEELSDQQISIWDQQTLAGEYNTVQISKEAEEELDEEQEEWEAAVAQEEAVVEREKGKLAADDHTELV
ncbi:hypothetical protein ATCC90586_004574 [Pythium insidiosum]|nr:hypothetical protein ATCC90586_004574 [Pythium insidiosum]